MCQDGAGAFVISGAGRFPTPVPFFEPDSDSVCAPLRRRRPMLGRAPTAPTLPRATKPATICAAPGQSVELAGRNLSDWNNPTLRSLDAANRALVAAAPLVALCHQGLSGSCRRSRAGPAADRGVGQDVRAHRAQPDARGRVGGRFFDRPPDAHRVRAVSVDVNQTHEASGSTAPRSCRSGSTATCRRASRWPRRSSTRGTPARL